MKVLYESIVGDATITATSANVNFPVTNLSDPQITSAYKTATSTLTTSIYLDYSEEVTFNALYLLDNNLTPDATVTIKCGTAQGLGDLYEEEFAAWNPLLGFGEGGFGDHGFGGYLANEEMTNLFGAPNSFYYPSSTIPSSAHVTIEIEDAGNADGYIKVGCLSMGWAFEPSREYRVAPLTIGKDDDTIITTLKGGQIKRTVSYKRLFATMKFKDIHEDEVFSFEGWFAYSGKSTDFVIHLFNDWSGVDGHKVLWGHFEKVPVVAISRNYPPVGETDMTVYQTL